jgi:hypothetical protein
MANPRQFELISRSCCLNPFLLRELREFNNMELPTRPVGQKFISAVKKYFLQFHTFEYSTLRDKVEGVTVVLDLWETLVAKFTISATDLSHERRVYDLIVALANRMDFDIDPVWLQWKQGKKKTGAVQMLMDVHVRYVRLLVLSVRLALTRISHPHHAKNSAVSQFAMRMLAVALLRLPFMRKRLLKVLCGFSSRRISHVRRLVDKYRERQQAMEESGGDFDTPSVADSSSSSASRYFIMLGNNRAPSGPLSVSGSSRSLLSTTSSFSRSSKSALFESASDLPPSSLLRNSLSVTSTRSARTSSSHSGRSRAKGKVYGWVEDLFQELDGRWAQFQAEGVEHAFNYAEFKAKAAAGPSRRRGKRGKGQPALPRVVRSSVQLQSHRRGNYDDSKQDGLGISASPVAASPAPVLASKHRQGRRERMQSSASPAGFLDPDQPPLVTCKIKEEHPELFEWGIFNNVAIAAAQEPFNKFITISAADAEGGAEHKALSALSQRLQDAKHNDNFFELAAAYLYHIARRAQKEVWHTVPGFLDISKHFFLRLVDRFLDSHADKAKRASVDDTVQASVPSKRTSLDWAQSALMLNPEPNGVCLGWICAIALKTTRLDDREAVVQTWGHLNEWCSTYVTALRRTNERPMLPSVLCEDCLSSAIMLSLRNSHFHVNFSCLLFLYNQWYHIPDEQLLEILFGIVSDRQLFYGLFAHWSYAVRVLFHNCLVFIGYALRLAINCLVSSSIAPLEMGEQTPSMTPSVLEDSKSDILLRDNQFVRDNSTLEMGKQDQASGKARRASSADKSGSTQGGTGKRSTFACLFGCFGSSRGGYTQADTSKTKKGQMDTEISLSRIAGPVESDIVRGGLKVIHSLVEGNNDQTTLDLHHQDTPNLLNTLDLNVEDLKDYLYSDLKKESTSNNAMPSPALGGARKSIDASSSTAACLKAFNMSKLQQAVIEYDNLMHRCEQIQNFDDGGFDCVLPVVINVAPDTEIEDVLLESNRKLEMARRESFKKILAMSSNSPVRDREDDMASVSSGVEMTDIKTEIKEHGEQRSDLLSQAP